MTDPALMARLRPAHSLRTAESHAAFLLPHLRPGMALLDLGCGPGSITAGLAAKVSPGPTTGVDLAPVDAGGFTFVQADVTDLPFPDNSFDAVFACALLQHLPDPLPALREARRVARPGAIIGITDIDTAATVIEPSDPWLAKSFEVSAAMRAGDPRTGRRLRGLLHEAGFSHCTATARAFHHGDPEETRALGDFNETWYATTEVVDRIVRLGLATAEETAAMSAAWAAWGRSPGAFYIGLWCDALAFAAATATA